MTALHIKPVISITQFPNAPNLTLKRHVNPKNVHFLKAQDFIFNFSPPAATQRVVNQLQEFGVTTR